MQAFRAQCGTHPNSIAAMASAKNKVTPMQNTDQANQTINAIVDNLADKLGIAVEQLQPIAETVVAETARLGAMYLWMIAGSVVAVLMFCIPVLVSAWRKKLDFGSGDDANTAIFGIALASAIIVPVLGAVMTADALEMYAAPTLHVLTTVLG